METKNKNYTPGELTTDGYKLYGGLKTIGQPLGIKSIGTINQGGLGDPGGNPKDNAARLVKCWNSHDKLLEALEEARRYIVAISDYTPESANLCKQMDQAIKEATG